MTTDHQPILVSLLTRSSGGGRMFRSMPALALLCLAFAPSRALAQYRFDLWTADNGLPQNIITAIHQTRDGYLWVATLDGLARFDGVRFTVFNKSNTPGISSNRFTSLYQDTQGDLWAGTEVGVVTRYHQGQFITYTTEHGLPKSFVPALTGDQQGRLWVLSGNKIREWEPAAGRFIEPEAPPFSGGSGSVAWSGEGGIWGVEQAELRLLTRGEWTHLALPAEVGRQITYAAKADDGAIWIVAAGWRLFRLKDGKVTAFPHWNHPPQGLGRTARPLTEWRDRAGKIWEMEVGQNLLRKLTIPSSGQPETITLRTLYEDRDGNLWLRTNGQGLYRIRKQIITTYSREQGLISRNVYPICEDRAGAIWVGLWDGGLSQIKAGKITNFTTWDGLSAESVTALCEDRAGRLWIATRTDLQTFEQGRFTSVKAQYPSAQTITNVIYQDRMGAMWFGTEQGLFRYHNGQAQHFTTRDGLPGEVVRVIIEAAEGGVWVGCYGGLMRWRDGKITSWTEQDGLPGNAVRALYEDQDGVAVIDPAAVPMNQQPPPVLIEEVLLDRTPIAFRDGVRLQPGQANLEIQYTALSFNNAAWSRFKYKIEGLDHNWIDAGTQRTAFFSYLPPGSYTFKVIAANSDGVWNTEGRSLRVTVLPPFYRTWWFLSLAALGVVGAARCSACGNSAMGSAMGPATRRAPADNWKKSSKPPAKPLMK